MPRRFPPLLLLIAMAAANAQPPLTFADRKLTLTAPEVVQKEGFWPKGPASVCLEAQPLFGIQRQCYTMPENFGGNPDLQIIQVDPVTPALLFSARGGGVSGFRIDFAMLGAELQNLFVGPVILSDQSRHAFWSYPSISPAKIFLTADYEWGPGECPRCPHRFLISAYLFDKSSGAFFLGDRYMTVRFYDGTAEDVDILTSERPEILARLKRIVQHR